MAWEVIDAYVAYGVKLALAVREVFGVFVAFILWLLQHLRL